MKITLTEEACKTTSIAELFDAIARKMGHMNGIRLLFPEIIARIVFGVLFIVGLVVFIKRILPLYKAAFADNNAD